MAKLKKTEGPSGREKHIKFLIFVIENPKIVNKVAMSVEIDCF